VDFGQPKVNSRLKNVVQNPLFDLFAGESGVDDIGKYLECSTSPII
jgi:hypothetical protein